MEHLDVTTSEDYFAVSNKAFKQNYSTMLTHIRNPNADKPAYEYFQSQPDRDLCRLRGDLKQIKAQYFKKSYQNEINRAKDILKGRELDGIAPTGTSQFEIKYFMNDQEKLETIANEVKLRDQIKKDKEMPREYKVQQRMLKENLDMGSTILIPDSKEDHVKIYDKENQENKLPDPFRTTKRSVSVMKNLDKNKKSQIEISTPINRLQKRKPGFMGLTFNSSAINHPSEINIAPKDLKREFKHLDFAQSKNKFLKTGNQVAFMKT